MIVIILSVEWLIYQLKSIVCQQDQDPYLFSSISILFISLAIFFIFYWFLKYFTPMLQTYIGMEVSRFCFRCHRCLSEISIKTDPMNLDCVVESGAVRNQEPKRAQDEVTIQLPTMFLELGDADPAVIVKSWMQLIADSVSRAG